MIAGVRELSGASFIRLLKPFMRALPSWLNHLAKAPTNIITLGIRFQYVTSGEGAAYSVYSGDHLDQSVLVYEFDHSSLRVRNPGPDSLDMNAGFPTYQLRDFEELISFFFYCFITCKIGIMIVFIFLK